MIEEHGSHKFQHIGETRQEYEGNVIKLIATVKDKLGVYTSDLERIKTIEELLQSNSDCIRKQLNENFDAYMVALESRRAALLAEIDDECQADGKKVWAHKEFTETAIADVIASLRFAERAHSCSNSVKMIHLTKQAIQRLETLSTKEHKLDDAHKVVVSTTTYYYSTHKEKELSTLDGIVRPKASLQLLSQGTSQLGQQITISVNMVNQPISMYQQLDVTPTITITYGHSKKSFHNFVIAKSGESWTVTMDLICGGNHIVSASLLGYSAPSKVIRVSGLPIVGARVRPGPDWSGAAIGEGTVTDASSKSGYNYTHWSEVRVRWDDGRHIGPYRWGVDQEDSKQLYQIELVPNED